jgi:hypothetical protein
MHRACLRSQDVDRGMLAMRNEVSGIAINSDLSTHSEGGEVYRRDGTAVVVCHKHIKADGKWTPAAQGRNRQQEGTSVHLAPCALPVQKHRQAPGGVSIVQLADVKDRHFIGSPVDHDNAIRGPAQKSELIHPF